MNLVFRQISVVAVFSTAAAISSAQDHSNREFLLPIDPQTKSALIDLYALEIRTLEFFAKPGKFDIFAYDVGALEAQGETISITAFGAPGIELVSHGIWRDPRREGKTANWRGTLPAPPSHGAYRARLKMFVFTADAQGNLKFPDPDLEPTKSILENGGRVNLTELDHPRTEKLIYQLTGNEIQVPETSATIQFVSLRENLDYVVVYEVDEEKVIYPGDDSPVNPVPPSREQVRRREAYNAHVENVRRDLALPLDQ